MRATTCLLAAVFTAGDSVEALATSAVAASVGAVSVADLAECMREAFRHQEDSVAAVLAGVGPAADLVVRDSEAQGERAASQAKDSIGPADLAVPAAPVNLARDSAGRADLQPVNSATSWIYRTRQQDFQALV